MIKIYKNDRIINYFLINNILNMDNSIFEIEDIVSEIFNYLDLYDAYSLLLSNKKLYDMKKINVITDKLLIQAKNYTRSIFSGKIMENYLNNKDQNNKIYEEYIKNVTKDDIMNMMIFERIKLSEIIIYNDFTSINKRDKIFYMSDVLSNYLIKSNNYDIYNEIYNIFNLLYDNYEQFSSFFCMYLIHCLNKYQELDNININNIDFLINNDFIESTNKEYNKDGIIRILYGKSKVKLIEKYDFQCQDIKYYLIYGTPEIIKYIVKKYNTNKHKQDIINTSIRLIDLNPKHYDILIDNYSNIEIKQEILSQTYNELIRKKII